MKKLLLTTLIISAPLLVSPAIAENAFDGTGVNITIDSNSPLDTVIIKQAGTIEDDDNHVTATTSSDTPLQEAQISENIDAKKLLDTNTQAEATNAIKDSIVIVKKGDSLSKIALRVYGDASRYREIVEANKDRYPSIVKNPDLIYAGWELEMPGLTVDKQEQAATNNGNSTASSSEPTASIDTAEDSSAQIVKIPNFTTAEKISHLQKSVDAANRALLGQGKVIKVLTASVVRFLIDKNFLSEEEWMAMNPPAGYMWKIDSLGKVLLAPTNNKADAPATEKIDSPEGSSTDDLAAKEKARLDKERLAEEAAEKAKAEAEAEEAKKIQSEYSKFLSEKGMIDFRANTSDYVKGIKAGYDLTVKGALYDRGTKFYMLFHAKEDSPLYLPLLQRELVEANERYAKLKNNNSDGKFMDSRDNDAEAALKVVNAKKAEIEKVWGMIAEALEQAEVDAEGFRNSGDTEEAQRKLEHYDTLKSIFK